MPVINISEKNKRILVSIDDLYIGYLYSSDIMRLSLTDGMEISDALADEIREKIFDRMFFKALSYLERAEYCAEEIRFKLSHSDCSKEMMDGVIEKLYKNSYLDDKRYALSFLRSYSGKKGLRLMETELSYKNIPKEIIKDAVDEYLEDEGYSEDDAIKRILDKKYKDADMSDPKIKSKVVAYLVRKGFPIDKVNNHLT